MYLAFVATACAAGTDMSPWSTQYFGDVILENPSILELDGLAAWCPDSFFEPSFAVVTFDRLMLVTSLDITSSSTIAEVEIQFTSGPQSFPSYTDEEFPSGVIPSFFQHFMHHRLVAVLNYVLSYSFSVSR